MKNKNKNVIIDNKEKNSINVPKYALIKNVQNCRYFELFNFISVKVLIKNTYIGSTCSI